MTQCLHHDMKDAGIKVYAFPPGFTQTDMVKDIFASEVYRNSGRAGNQVKSPPGRPAKVLKWLAREAPTDLAGEHVEVSFDDIGKRAGLEDALIPNQVPA